MLYFGLNNPVAEVSDLTAWAGHWEQLVQGWMAALCPSTSEHPVLCKFTLLKKLAQSSVHKDQNQLVCVQPAVIFTGLKSHSYYSYSYYLKFALADHSCL